MIVGVEAAGEVRAEILTPEVGEEFPTPSEVEEEILAPSEVEEEIPTHPKVEEEILTPSEVEEEIPAPSEVEEEIPTPSEVGVCPEEVVEIAEGIKVIVVSHHLVMGL